MIDRARGIEVSAKAANRIFDSHERINRANAYSESMWRGRPWRDYSDWQDDRSMLDREGDQDGGGK